ncbi:MAG: zinc-ribbon domain-containing protein [Promethearchaeota archaeon]|nr:MAG: zinc-ribbon domain-containing protein [Candidatus Lokiarchaeota archaeon]
MTQYDDKIYEEILGELETSFKEGKIDEASYMDLKQRYEKKLAEARVHREEARTISSFQVSGSQRVTSDAVKISGSASIPGGVVPKIIKVAGSCRIADDIECNGLRVAGSLHSNGAIVSHGDVSVSGSFHGDGILTAEGDVDVSGSCKIGGDINVTGVVTVSGSMQSDGNIYGKGGIRVYGSGKSDGDMFSENDIEVKGSVKVDGDVRANKVKFAAPVVFKRLLRKRARSQVDGDIIGQESVEIENIHVDGNVRGRVVIIGRNSKIEGTIEYVDDLQVAEDAVLENQPVKVSAETLGVPLQAPPKTEIKFKTPEALAHPSFCPKCGQEVDKGLKFCPACGASLE